MLATNGIRAATDRVGRCARGSDSWDIARWRRLSYARLAAPVRAGGRGARTVSSEDPARRLPSDPVTSTGTLMTTSWKCVLRRAV